MAVYNPITELSDLPEKLTWNFSQVFGDSVDATEEIAEADIISSVKFNHTGEYLATGDRGGRVVLFERNQTDVGSPAEYRFYTEFQSHEAEFDYLKSLEIEEKINQIEWLKQCNSSHFLLTTNDKTVKLWKVTDKPVRVVQDPDNIGSGRIPQLNRTDTSQPEARCKRVFAHAHAYHINSISINSDEETFISTDDLRINLWNLAVTDQSFNIVDIKPENMEELTEVITCSQFHPTHCNIFAYGSSRGGIKLADMRSSALCDQHSKQLEVQVDPAKKSFFSEIISSISDVKFSHDGRYIMSRDYLTVKIWDVTMEREPVEEYPIHNYLKPRLCDVYENDCIFDKFEATWSGDDQQILAGSYNNLFHVFDRESHQDVILHASRDAIEGPTHVLSPINVATGEEVGSMHVDNLNFGQKIMHAAWHPTMSIVALAAVNNLYLFRQ